MKKKDISPKGLNIKRAFIILTICSLLVSTSVVGARPSGFQALANTGKTESQVKDQLSNVKDDRAALNKEMSEVSAEIKRIQAKVETLTQLYNKTVKEISYTEQQIKKKQEEMELREENLNQRLKVMYKNGSVGFIDVLLGSNSISEFVSNLEIIKRIYRNDVDVLELLKEEHEALEKAKAELKRKKSDLANQKIELDEEKENLKEKKKELEKEEDELKAEADRLTAELKAIIDANSKYVGGVFAWPVPSSHYISSTFGNRLHPILKTWKFHTGTDIGAPAGATIVAAGNGTVIMAQWYGGYGNCIIIDHGGGITTLYGHCSSIAVGAGTVVKKGQTIGAVGSTGRSTGPHLHFEVRKGGEYVNPMSYYS